MRPVIEVMTENAGRVTALKSPAGFADDYSEESDFAVYYCITCSDRLNLHAYTRDEERKI